jgi:phosphatidylserine/phosphatidylglycerophosphate/cardiolipin synthase-like enzyme
LLTTCNTHGKLELGTGYNIFKDTILSAIESAENEVILVTCFWARSATLDALNESLRKLSAKSTRQGGKKIRVRLCFSSLSIFQKLFQTNSLDGKTYTASQWPKKLGLPNASELDGLDMRVKSIFIRPFSVLHPKFVIIDRRAVFLPSCNVSWEDWFEGCATLSGNVVKHFVDTWNVVWADEDDKALPNSGIHNGAESFQSFNEPLNDVARSSSATHTLNEVQSIFLPSPHHANPQFSLLPWKPCVPPPPTPLNTFLLAAFEHARSTIYIQTPNLSSPPVLSALLSALSRGINVEILTSERLMILEQLVTAGTTTKRCIKTLVKRHRRLVDSNRQDDNQDDMLLEAGHAGKPGKLKVSFYQPKLDTDGKAKGHEPVQSHLKLTVIDGEWTVLGSGNMDRASWYTSQELGLAFFSEAFARQVQDEVEGWMQRRKKLVYENSVS